MKVFTLKKIIACFGTMLCKVTFNFESFYNRNMKATSLQIRFYKILGKI